ncbi:MAG: hypothetical protein KGZ74_10190 [Chitinophagaceae bacterium]|nr:hypothetical protein [Chitinophagaceae bacterium]
MLSLSVTSVELPLFAVVKSKDCDLSYDDATSLFVNAFSQTGNPFLVANSVTKWCLLFCFFISSASAFTSLLTFSGTLKKAASIGLMISIFSFTTSCLLHDTGRMANKNTVQKNQGFQKFL